MNSQIREVLDVCAARLESRAIEMDRQAKFEPHEGWQTIAAVLRAEAAIIRAGCHRYGEKRDADTPSNQEVLTAFTAALKKDFSDSPRFKGYDADEDQGYFIEWLIERFFSASTKLRRIQEALDREWPMPEDDSNYDAVRTVEAITEICGDLPTQDPDAWLCGCGEMNANDCPICAVCRKDRRKRTVVVEFLVPLQDCPQGEWSLVLYRYHNKQIYACSVWPDAFRSSSKMPGTWEAGVGAAIIVRPGVEVVAEKEVRGEIVTVRLVMLE